MGKYSTNLFHNDSNVSNDSSMISLVSTRDCIEKQCMITDMLEPFIGPDELNNESIREEWLEGEHLYFDNNIYNNNNKIIIMNRN